MALTIGNWILVGILTIIGILVTLVIGSWYYEDSKYDFDKRIEVYHKNRLLGFIVTGIISLIIVAGTIGCFHWYHTSFASGIRSYKDFKSNINNGIYREITITNENGKVIYDYTGKCDIQEQEQVDERKLKFEDEKGKRVIIYYGITDTVKIIEKEYKNATNNN